MHGSKILGKTLSAQTLKNRRSIATYTPATYIVTEAMNLINIVTTTIILYAVHTRKPLFNRATHSLVDVHHVDGIYMYINW